MEESLVIDSVNGKAHLWNADWPRRIHIDPVFLDLVRRGGTTDAIRLDDDGVVITVQNGSATYRLVGPCEGEHPEYALVKSVLIVDGPD